MKIISFISAALFVFFTQWSFAASLDPEYLGQASDGMLNYSDYEEGITTVPAEWVGPNEFTPQYLAPLFDEQQQAGAYMAVGTERGFIAASLWIDCQALILLDIDNDSVLYNVINTALLKISLSRQDYLNLRLNPDHEKLKTRLDDAFINSDTKKLVLNNWNWWLFSQGAHEGLQLLNRIEHFTDNSPFNGASYLVDDDQFDRLSKLAKNNRIFVAVGNMNIAGHMAEVEDFCRHLQIKISFIDTSNCLEADYHYGFDFLQTLRRLQESAHDNFQFISTFWHSPSGLVPNSSLTKNGSSYVIFNVRDFLSGGSICAWRDFVRKRADEISNNFLSYNIKEMRLYKYRAPRLP